MNHEEGLLVGMCGAAGSGKDTAGSALIEHAGFRKLSFAAELKRILCDIFYWRMEDWEDLEWKEAPNPSANGKTPRQVAQWFGTDFMRDRIDRDFWVKRAVQMVSPVERYVVTDVRFPNEAAAIRKAGGILLFIQCLDRETGTDQTGHESEAWLPWLDLYADCKIAAAFGHIDKLKEAAVNVVENYLQENVPKVEHSSEVLAELNRIEREIESKLRGDT